MPRPIRFCHLAVLMGLLLQLAGAQTAAAVPAPPAPLPPDTLLARLRRPALPDTLRVQYLLLTGFYQQASDLPAAQRYAEQALALSRRIGYPTGTAKALEMLGNTNNFAGRYLAAQSYFEKALALNKRLGRARGIGNSYLGLGNVYTSLSESAQALRFYQQAGAAYGSIKPPHLEGQLLVLNNTAGLHSVMKQPEQAARAFRQALALTEGGVQPRLRVAVLRGLGYLQLQAQQPDSAQPLLTEGLRLAAEIGEQREESGMRSGLAELALLRGRPAEAYVQATEAARLARQSGHVAELQEALLALANALHALKRPYAYDTLRRYLTLHDTLLARDRADALIAGQARFRAVEQQARISSLEKDQRLSEQASELAKLRYRYQVAGLGGLSLLAVAISAGLFLQYRRRQQARDAALRQRLAADLHDDVGSLLTQISLQSDLLRETSAAPAQTLARLERLSDTSRRAARQMADVVWGLHTSAAELPEVLAHMRDHAHEVLPTAELSLDFEVSEEAAALRPSALVCQTLYLIYKEALHNAVKHARQASQVAVRLSVEAGRLCMSVKDDSPGPAPVGRVGGQGLSSMRQRAEAVGGTLSVVAAADGFGVTACLPV